MYKYGQTPSQNLLGNEMTNIIPASRKFTHIA